MVDQSIIRTAMGFANGYRLREASVHNDLLFEHVLDLKHVNSDH